MAADRQGLKGNLWPDDEETVPAITPMPTAAPAARASPGEIWGPVCRRARHSNLSCGLTVILVWASILSRHLPIEIVALLLEPPVSSVSPTATGVPAGAGVQPLGPMMSTRPAASVTDPTGWPSLAPLRAVRQPQSDSRRGSAAGGSAASAKPPEQMPAVAARKKLKRTTTAALPLDVTGLRKPNTGELRIQRPLEYTQSGAASNTALLFGMRNRPSGEEVGREGKDSRCRRGAPCRRVRDEDAGRRLGERAPEGVGLRHKAATAGRGPGRPRLRPLADHLH